MKQSTRTNGKLNGLAMDRVAELEAELAMERKQVDALSRNLQKSRAEYKNLSRMLHAAQRTQTDLQEQLRIRHYELGERVKELHCLYSISRLFEDRDRSKTAIFKGIVDAIPPSWQYPELTSARIVYADGEVCSESFQISPWKLSAPIKVFDNHFGELEIYYSAEKPEMDEGPFLLEERELLNELARRLGVHLERLEVEESARDHELAYRELFELGLIGMAIIDPKDRHWLEINDRLCGMLGYTADELHFLNLADITHPDDVLAGLREFEKVLSGQENGHLADRRFIRKDGSVFHATMSLRAVFSSQGAVRRVYALLYDITDRVLAEQRLVQSQLMVQHIFDTIDVGLCLVGKDQRVVRTNATFAKLMRLESSIVGKDLYDALAGVYVPKEFCPVQRAFVNRRVERTEHRIFYPNEGERWFEVHGYPLSDSGNEGDVVMLLREITQQKKIQSALSERLDFIQTLINAVPNPIFYKDSSGVYLGCNRAYEEFMQLHSKELVGQTAYGIAPYDLAAHYEERDKELLKKPGVQIYESSIRRGDGILREVLFYKATYGKYANNPTGIVGVIVDITDRKETEETLRENAAFLQVVLESIKTSLIIVDAESLEIVDVNSDAEKLTGYSKQELLGQKCVKLLSGFNSCPPQAADCTSCPYEEGRQMHNVEDTLRRPDGRTVPVLRSVLPVTLKGRRHMVEIAFDLTEHKALEQQLIYTQKLESIGHLASGLAHEINHPLHAVGENIHTALKKHSALSSLLEILLAEHQARSCSPSQNTDTAWDKAESMLQELDPKACSDEIPAALRQAAEGMGRLAEIIHGLTKFSGSASDSRKPADLNEAIENTLMVSRSEWQYLAEVFTDLDPKLPLVTCRLSDFNQVLLNLLVSAAKNIELANPKEKGRIEIRTRKQGKQAVITIQDTGGTAAGWESAPQGADSLLNARQQDIHYLDELSIARNVVVKTLGGSLDVDVLKNTGTSVTVRLPFDARPLPEQQS